MQYYLGVKKPESNQASVRVRSGCKDNITEPNRIELGRFDSGVNVRLKIEIILLAFHSILFLLPFFSNTIRVGLLPYVRLWLFSFVTQSSTLDILPSKFTTILRSPVILPSSIILCSLLFVGIFFRSLFISQNPYWVLFTQKNGYFFFFKKLS